MESHRWCHVERLLGGGPICEEKKNGEKKRGGRQRWEEAREGMMASPRWQCPWLHQIEGRLKIKHGVALLGDEEETRSRVGFLKICLNLGPILGRGLCPNPRRLKQRNNGPPLLCQPENNQKNKDLKCQHITYRVTHYMNLDLKLFENGLFYRRTKTWMSLRRVITSTNPLWRKRWEKTQARRLIIPVM